MSAPETTAAPLASAEQRGAMNFAVHLLARGLGADARDVLCEAFGLPPVQIDGSTMMPIVVPPAREGRDL